MPNKLKIDASYQKKIKYVMNSIVRYYIKKIDAYYFFINKQSFAIISPIFNEAK